MSFANPSFKNRNKASYETFVTSVQKAKIFCKIKYALELKMQEFTKPIKEKQNEMLHSLKEEALSPRKINAARVIFEKSKDMKIFHNPNEKELTPREKAEKIFELIVSDFGNGNNSDFMRSRYYDAQEKIVEYYEYYYTSKIDIDKLKEAHNNNIDVVKEEVINEGLPISMVNYVYKCFKTDVGLLLQGHGVDELMHFDDVYNEIREELLKEFSYV